MTRVYDEKYFADLQAKIDAFNIKTIPLRSLEEMLPSTTPEQRAEWIAIIKQDIEERQDSIDNDDAPHFYLSRQMDQHKKLALLENPPAPPIPKLTVVGH